MYVLSCDGINFKIGRTKDINKRIRQLNTARDENLTLVISCQTMDSLELEKILHRKFNHYRVNREWFKLNRWCLIEIERIFSYYQIK